jgi:hypothetical protein
LLDIEGAPSDGRRLSTHGVAIDEAEFDPEDRCFAIPARDLRMTSFRELAG